MLWAGNEESTELHHRTEAGLEMMLLGHSQQKSVSISSAVVKTANIWWRPVWEVATGVGPVVEQEIHRVDRAVLVRTRTLGWGLSQGRTAGVTWGSRSCRLCWVKSCELGKKGLWKFVKLWIKIYVGKLFWNSRVLWVSVSPLMIRKWETLCR